MANETETQEIGCVICGGKGTLYRGLCSEHYRAAKRMNVSEEFNANTGAKLIKEAEVAAYLAKMRDARKSVSEPASAAQTPQG
jgi:hypothetical protein